MSGLIPSYFYTRADHVNVTEVYLEVLSRIRKVQYELSEVERKAMRKCETDLQVRAPSNSPTPSPNLVIWSKDCRRLWTTPPTLWLEYVLVYDTSSISEEEERDDSQVRMATNGLYAGAVVYRCVRRSSRACFLQCLILLFFFYFLASTSTLFFCLHEHESNCGQFF